MYFIMFCRCYYMCALNIKIENFIAKDKNDNEIKRYKLIENFIVKDKNDNE